MLSQVTSQVMHQNVSSNPGTRKRFPFVKSKTVLIFHSCISGEATCWILKTKVYLMLENGESNKSPEKLSIWYSLDIVFNWLTINLRKSR